jgi:hypothetical protein
MTKECRKKTLGADYQHLRFRPYSKISRQKRKEKRVGLTQIFGKGFDGQLVARKPLPKLIRSFSVDCPFFCVSPKEKRGLPGLGRSFFLALSSSSMFQD